MLVGDLSVTAVCRANRYVGWSRQQRKAVKMQGRKWFQKELELNKVLMIFSKI